ncbi:MAG TPA: sugar kinase [Baekduia sp.]|uniref:sugar kinase n=1 Tax=Baekduia sp. TaxID=2600305 RepID=UPI002C5D443B|nr:sugar kinase [Baekduia sp.]HMJ34304.1 sugar kinase [Baekduia sp.]
MTTIRDGKSQDGTQLPDSGGAGAAVVGAIGEGLLEVSLDPTLAEASLGRGFGGDAANVAVMAAKAGARARLLTRVGDDTAGRMLLEFWRGAGVDLSAVEVDPDAATGLYVNERDELGAHRFSYHRMGSAASLLARRHAAGPFLRGLDVLHVTGITLSISASASEAAELLAERARHVGVPVSFSVNYRAALNPDREQLATFARASDLVFLSVEDAHALFGAEHVEDVAAALGMPAMEIVMTHGAGPATLLSGRELHTLAPPRVEAIDAAGAGDALAGAYLAARFSGAEPRRALAHGVVAGALSCRGTGCARSYPSATEVTTALLSLGEVETVLT